MLLRWLSVPEPVEVGKLERLPRPGLRVYRPPTERGTEARFSNSLEIAAGVGVGVGEPSETVSAGGGGLTERSEPLALVLSGREPGDSVGVPFETDSLAATVFTIGCSPVVEEPLIGTSRLVPRVVRRSAGLETLIGNRPISEAPLERSRRCARRPEGLVARLRLTMAR